MPTIKKSLTDRQRDPSRESLDPVFRAAPTDATVPSTLMQNNPRKQPPNAAAVGRPRRP
jgi:hypothetical protein